MTKQKVISVIMGIAIIAVVIGIAVTLVIALNKKKELEPASTVATEAPTKKPTQKPTEAPTEEPTETPTVEPTEEVTLPPTVAPTAKATKKPAKKTPKPTLKPELLLVTVKPDDVEDPGNNVSDAVEEMGTGEKVDFDEVANDNDNEIEGTTNGIDVSSHNGVIDWQKVAATGVEFAMIRVGYRGWGTGEIVEDSQAKANFEGATANGIKVGAYFFSTAISEEEAIDEALWTCNFISNYRVTYPIAYDCEQYKDPTHRNYVTTNTTRTDYALAFLNMVKEEGYTPMFYNSSYQLVHEWETDRIRDKYKIWKANYSDTEKYYFEKFSMWQYTSSGSVDGINGRVDLNTAYFGYKAEEEAKIAAYGMTFTDTMDTMYAKKGARLRSVPSSSSQYTIKYTMGEFEPITRTGIGDGAWDRILYNGETVYVYKSNIITKEQYENYLAATPKPSPTVKPTGTPDPNATVDPNSTINPETTLPADATSSPNEEPSVTGSPSDVPSPTEDVVTAEQKESAENTIFE